MARDDPYPNQLLLSAEEVRTILGIKSRTDWADFLKDNEGFPQARPCGKTRGKQPRLKWKKSLVLAWIDLNWG